MRVLARDINLAPALAEVRQARLAAKASAATALAAATGAAGAAATSAVAAVQTALGGYVADAQAAAELAVDISGITIPDDVIDAAFQLPDGKAAARLSATFVPVITPEAFGAVGDGSADDTAAVVAACNAASALKRAVFAGISEPGATLRLSKEYYLATLAEPLVMSCNVDGPGVLYAPADYAGTVVLVGSPEGGTTMRNADLKLPTVRKPNGTAVIPAGSCGIQVQNLTHSRVDLRLTMYFETGVWFTAHGANAGTFSNRVFLGQIDLCKVALRLAQRDAGAYVTSNTFNGGGIMQSENGYGGPALRRPGYRHVVLDGTLGFSVQGNTFVGLSIEGPLSEVMIDFIRAADNVFIGGNRLELGTLGEVVAPDFEYNVFYSPDNPLNLAVGDAVVLTGDAPPGGVTLSQLYWVYATGGSGAGFNFSITTTEGSGGAPVDILTAGSGVRAIRPPTIRFDNSSGFTRGNVLRDYNTYPGPLDIQRVGDAAGDAYPEVHG